MALWTAQSPAALLELVRADAELPSIGRARFIGTRKEQRALWLDYRNFLRQGLSNFRAAFGVDNRSASLLQYYAMLNFAKAELLSVSAPAVRGFVGHGLRFNASRAKTVASDSLTVTDGVFPKLYAHRTGRSIRGGTRLSITRLLSRIPEIGQQLAVTKIAPTEVAGVWYVSAWDDSACWSLLAVEGSGPAPDTATGRAFFRVFERVDPPAQWRDYFGVSRRWSDPIRFYESRMKSPHDGTTASLNAALGSAAAYAWKARDVLETSSGGGFDAWLSPSLSTSKMLPMPPSLARYALAYYGSSLVRYRPVMFDAELSPEQAYLFDALARECPLPMLADTVASLTRTVHVFIGDEGLRL